MHTKIYVALLLFVFGVKNRLNMNEFFGALFSPKWIEYLYLVQLYIVETNQFT